MNVIRLLLQLLYILFIISSLFQNCEIYDKYKCITGYILYGISTLIWFFYVNLHKIMCKSCLKTSDNTVTADLIV